MLCRFGLRPLVEGQNSARTVSSLSRSFTHSTSRQSKAGSAPSPLPPSSPHDATRPTPKVKTVISPADKYSTMQIERRRLASYTRYGPFGPGALKPLYSRNIRGDPVRGKTTPYVESFDDPSLQPEPLLKHFFKADDIKSVTEELETALQPSSSDPSESIASEAVRRITSLNLGTLRDVKRANIQRSISTFGRHVTDYILPGKPVASPTSGEINTGREDLSVHANARAGPDTGSPEVQIGILTARIRRIANEQAGRGRKDIVARRNLTKLVHRRQQLLRYMHRKERGGPRWVHLIETLGLTEATWQGEINLPRKKGPRAL